MDLTDVGFNGTWDEFCNYDKQVEEFSGFPDHDAMRIRRLLCQMKDNDKINRQSLSVFGAYKYCESVSRIFLSSPKNLVD